MGAIAVNTAKWTLDVLTRLIKANVRLHNAEAVKEDMSPLFVVNHFTRLETILLPYILNKHIGREVWSLAAEELFVGRIGEFLLAMGTVSTEDVTEYTTHGILLGVTCGETRVSVEAKMRQSQRNRVH